MLELAAPMDVWFGRPGDRPRPWSITSRGTTFECPDGDYSSHFVGQAIEAADLFPDALLRVKSATVADGYLTLSGVIEGSVTTP